jgi:predicted dehydrogenase
MNRFSRRTFVSNTSKIIIGAGLAANPVASAIAANPRISANDKIGIGLIGCRGMGWANFREIIKHPEIDPIAICDIDDEVLNNRGKDFEEMTGKKPQKYKDFRKFLENKDIDAVIIATPDHWHCLNLVQACQAGKDVYVEKPLANSIEECNIMLAAARKHSRVVQVGQWQRSGPHWINAMNYIHEGNLGKISQVKSWLYYPNQTKMEVKPEEPVPAGVDYEMWLGPAPKRPFNRNRFHGSWRYFWDYGGGLMTDWGVHLLDMAFYGMQAPLAKSAIASGGKFAFPDSAMETPDTQNTVYEFEDFQIVWEHGMGVSPNLYHTDQHGVAFAGQNGTLAIDRDKWNILPEVREGKYLIPKIPTQTGNYGGLAEHIANFIDCLKTRKKPNADIEIGRNVAINAHMGNIAYRTGRKIYYDELKNEFKNDPEANALVKPEYSNGWKLPVV